MRSDFPFHSIRHRRGPISDRNFLAPERFVDLHNSGVPRSVISHKSESPQNIDIIPLE